MITEEQWAVFGKYVAVGNAVQFRGYGHVINGVLLENYPHYQREHDPDPKIDYLRVKFDNGDTPDDLLVEYEYFKVNDPDDDAWYQFDDILRGDE